MDAGGAVYLAEGSIGSGSGLDGGDFRIWKVTGNKIFTVAGTGLRSFSGDGGSAALAQFDTPAGMARDSSGNLYIADTRNNRIRKIAPDGTVTTVAGNVLPGFSGENGPAVDAELNGPTGVAVDADGNLYIADTGNNRVRLVYKSTGIIGTLAGNGNTALFGDGGSSAESGAESSPRHCSGCRRHRLCRGHRKPSDSQNCVRDDRHRRRRSEHAHPMSQSIATAASTLPTRRRRRQQILQRRVLGDAAGRRARRHDRSLRQCVRVGFRSRGESRGRRVGDHDRGHGPVLLLGRWRAGARRRV